MFSTELGYTLEAAYREAARRQHAFFCVEHLLFALLFDDQVEEIIRHCGGDLELLKEDLENFFSKHIETVKPEKEDAEASASVFGSKMDSSKETAPVQTPAVQRVLQSAIVLTQSSGRELITSREVFISIFSETDSHAAYFLRKQGIEKIDVLGFVSHGTSKISPLSEGSEGSPYEDSEAGEEEGERQGSALKRYAEDLTEMAEKGELDPLIGRQLEIERALKILSRRQKNNPIFIGDPGVGKTAMANAIALRIASGEVPANLKNAKLFSLSIGSLIAGTKFRGEFEDRLKNLVKELIDLKNAVLFIDEIHTIVGAGATGTGSMDAANLLKPALASGKLRCIGSSTHEDYKKSFEKDRALSRRFSVIDLDEPSVEETVKILEGLKGTFEKHHKVRFTHPALKSAAELASKHINDRFLPDKAIDVIDEAGAANSLLLKSKRKKAIGVKEIEEVVSSIARVPVKSVDASEEHVLKVLEPDLKSQVFGQDEAISSVVRSIKRSRANLKQDDKPVGCFLFAGPTGVGKTELAKVLSQELSVPFHRFDMSEYMEKHSVSRLTGAPPGYVGYDEGGILTDLVRRQPHAVLLFDEIEKAHQDVFNILLQVMDDARLTDSHGKKADFRNIIVIMTTNAGSESSGALGFGNASKKGKNEEAIKKLFRPEFRNRLDDIIYFNSLPEKVILKIVDKLLAELDAQLKERKVKVELTSDAKSWLAKNGFDPILGARPMARLIQTEIKDRLSDELLFGKLRKGGKVKISQSKDSKSLNFSFKQ